MNADETDETDPSNIVALTPVQARPVDSDPVPKRLPAATVTLAHHRHGPLTFNRQEKAAGSDAVEFSGELLGVELDLKLNLTLDDGAVRPLPHVKIFDVPEEVRRRGLAYIFLYMAASAALALGLHEMSVISTIDPFVRRTCVKSGMRTTNDGCIGEPAAIMIATIANAARYGWTLPQPAPAADTTAQG